MLGSLFLRNCVRSQNFKRSLPQPQSFGQLLVCSPLPGFSPQQQRPHPPQGWRRQRLQQPVAGWESSRRTSRRWSSRASHNLPLAKYRLAVWVNWGWRLPKTTKMPTEVLLWLRRLLRWGARQSPKAAWPQWLSTTGPSNLVEAGANLPRWCKLWSRARPGGRRDFSGSSTRTPSEKLVSGLLKSANCTLSCRPISRSMAHLVASPTSSPRYLTRRAAKLSKSMNDLLVMWLLWVVSSFVCVPMQCIQCISSSMVVVGHGYGQKWRPRQVALQVDASTLYSFHNHVVSWNYLWYVPSYQISRQFLRQIAFKISCSMNTNAKTVIWCAVHNITLKSSYLYLQNESNLFKVFTFFSLQNVEWCRLSM